MSRCCSPLVGLPYPRLHSLPESYLCCDNLVNPRLITVYSQQDSVLAVKGVVVPVIGLCNEDLLLDLVDVLVRDEAAKGQFVGTFTRTLDLERLAREQVESVE